jgi:hypothetical protein
MRTDQVGEQDRPAREHERDEIVDPALRIEQRPQNWGWR